MFLLLTSYFLIGSRSFGAMGALKLDNREKEGNKATPAMGRKSLLRCYSWRAFYGMWRQESCFYGNYNMRLSSTLKMGATLGIGIFSLSLYAVAGDHGHKNGHGHKITTPNAEPKATPPGNHFGWERGRHNPHRATPSPTP